MSIDENVQETEEGTTPAEGRNICDSEGHLVAFNEYLRIEPPLMLGKCTRPGCEYIEGRKATEKERYDWRRTHTRGKSSNLGLQIPHYEEN